VTIGPVIEDGFFYDFAPQIPFTVDDLPKIETRMKELARADLKIERIELPRAEAIKTFAAMGEKYKVEIIEEQIPEGQVASIYKEGDWMDLCRGPHVPSTRYLRAFKLLSVAGAYWRGDERNAMLSRIYGTAFASKEALEEHLRLLELARTRDHRKLGRELGLFLRSDFAGRAVLFAQGHDHSQRANRIHPPALLALRLPGSRDAPDLSQSAVSYVGPLGKLP